MSVYIPARYQQGGSRKMADDLIDMVEGFARQWPDKFTLVRSSAELQGQFPQEKLALALGMENGAPIQGDLGALKRFYDRGIRYITLTHSKNNHICDSSYDSVRKWKGLSPFGRRVVQEMNRLGIMIDVSHISDQAFSQVMELTKAPVIASHSSSRFFTPGWERNMSDEMLLRLKNNNGVIQISFGSSFVSDEYRKKSKARQERVDRHLKSAKLDAAGQAAQQYVEEYFREHPLERADISDVVDHIDHVVRLIGVDHVGIGSDFDGVGDSLPNGLRSVSDYPNLIYALLRRGYSDQDIEKICSGNLLRVWSEVERAAQEFQAIPWPSLTRVGLGFLEQAYLSNHHFFVYCLTHVVQGQGGRRHGRQGFHFDPRCPAATDSAANEKGILLKFNLHIYQIEGQSVAERDKLASLLGGLDSRQSSRLERTSFRQRHFKNQLAGLLRYEKLRLGNRRSAYHFFLADVHHASLSSIIYMRQFHQFPFSK